MLVIILAPNLSGKAAHVISHPVDGGTHSTPAVSICCQDWGRGVVIGPKLNIYIYDKLRMLIY